MIRLNAYILFVIGFVINSLLFIAFEFSGTFAMLIIPWAVITVVYYLVWEKAHIRRGKVNISSKYDLNIAYGIISLSTIGALNTLKHFSDFKRTFWIALVLFILINVVVLIHGLSKKINRIML